MPKTKTVYQWWRNATFWPVVCMALGSERRWFTSYFKKKDASPWWLVFHMLRLKITLMHTKAPPIDSSVSWIIALLFIEDPVELSKWALTGVHPSSRFIFFFLQKAADSVRPISFHSREVPTSTSEAICGFSILSKDTSTCRLGESNQRPSDNKTLALPPEPQPPHIAISYYNST